MYPISAIALSGLGLIWIGSLVYAGQIEARRHRQLMSADD
jgi:hypothetical protein